MAPKKLLDAHELLLAGGWGAMPKDPLPSGPQAWTRIPPQPWISKVFLAGEKGVQQEKWWFTARKELISAGEAGWEQLITVDNYIVQL